MEDTPNGLKKREDFETESEWWTYYVTNREKFDALENEEDEEEESNQAFYFKLECLNCGRTVIVKHKFPNLPPIEKIECGKCGKKLMKATLIDEKDLKKELENEKKKLEKLSDYKIKKIITRIEIDLEKIKYDLDKDLENGTISPERYIVLMLNLVAREYDYYASRVKKKFNWKNFKEMALEVAKGQVEEKYNCEVIDEKLEELARGYDEEKDKYFLEEYEILLNGRKQDEKDEDVLSELDREIKRIERRKEIVMEEEEKYAERKKDAEEKYKIKNEDDAIWNFEKRFKNELEGLKN